MILTAKDTMPTCVCSYISPDSSRAFLDLSHSHDIAAQKGDRRRHPRVNQKCGVVILAWLSPLAVLLLAVLPAARAPQKRVSHSSPARGRSGLLAISTLVQFRFFRTHTRTAQGIPRTFAVLPFGGRQSEIYSSHPPRLPSLPVVTQSDDSSNVRKTQPAPGPVDPGISLGRPPVYWLP
jgi:hypothetical protein